MKVKALNQLATEMVGDGKKQNVFFVTIEGNVAMVALDFEWAYTYWRRLSTQTPRVECMLEDRATGIIASAGIEEQFDHDANKIGEGWEVRDDSRTFGFRS